MEYIAWQYTAEEIYCAKLIENLQYVTLGYLLVRVVLLFQDIQRYWHEKAKFIKNLKKLKNGHKRLENFEVKVLKKFEGQKVRNKKIL